MASIRIYQKKQIRLDRLSFRQSQMFKIGNVGVAAVKNRLAASQGPSDGPAKPLTKQYAIWKTKTGERQPPQPESLWRHAAEFPGPDGQ